MSLLCTWSPKGGKKKQNRKTNAFTAAAAAAKSRQSCPTLCDPIDRSLPGSSVPGILQARTLEWVAISFSNAWKWKVKMKSLSRVWLSATPWTVAQQAPPSMGFPRQQKNVITLQLCKIFNINESLFSILMSFLSLISVIKKFLWWHEWISNDQTFL